jgi:hypothetical protein
MRDSVQLQIIASNSSLILYRQGHLDAAVQGLAQVAEECTQLYRQFSNILDTAYNPFKVHLAIQMDKSDSMDDYAIRFHAEISVVA